MTKIPVKTRLPAHAWAVAALVTLYSLVSSVAQGPADNASVYHAKLMTGDTLTTSWIR